MPLPLPEKELSALTGALLQGNKIEAIRQSRTAAVLGLCAEPAVHWCVRHA